MGDKVYKKLRGGEFIITDNKYNVYKVLTGNLLVFIIPYRNSTQGRRMFLCEAKEEELIPAYSYKDMEYCEWRFLLTAVEEVELEVKADAVTNVLKDSFIDKFELTICAKEGFDEGLRDLYKSNIVKEDGFIIRTQRHQERKKRNVEHLIVDLFKKRKKVFKKYEDTNTLYKSVYYLTYMKNMKCIPYSVLIKNCGKNFDFEDIANMSHFSYRQVTLEEEWYKYNCGDLIVTDQVDYYVAIYKNGTYYLYNPKTDFKQKVNKTNVRNLSSTAYALYKSFPSKSVELFELFLFVKESIKMSDLLSFGFLVILTTCIGLLIPTISQALYDKYIPLGSINVLFQLGCVLGGFMLANVAFEIVERLIHFRIISLVTNDLQAAFYDRLFQLPESFFRNYDTADLTGRVLNAGNELGGILALVIVVLSTFIMGLINFFRLLSYSSELAWIGLATAVVYSIVIAVVKLLFVKYKRAELNYNSATSSMLLQFISAIDKIRIAGVENSAIYEYMQKYIEQRKVVEKSEKIIDFGNILTTLSDSFFMMVIYVVIVKANMDLSLGSILAFLSLYSIFSSNVLRIMNSVIDIFVKRPELKRIQVILNETPECEETKEIVHGLNGAIEVNNVCFSYNKEERILNRISLNIKPGEYVGIVGTSGSGKSTLLKILLGFENPDSGKVYYDNRDLQDLDKSSLRRKIGVVLQNDSLIPGTIYENIVITNPKSTFNDVKDVIKKVGLQEDIDSMPMGLKTILNEGTSTISGGQMQRILIARALISNPKILLFDEATSALDNITQGQVCASLDALNVTRIVIAHRLSTIMNCTRIFVMDNGEIVEEGNYNSLMQKKGIFYNLAKRQLID